MMFAELNASNYEYSRPFYIAEFENILSKIVLCYNLMLENKVALSNDENAIRDILYLKYLNDNITRTELGLKDYFFDRETIEDRTIGRTDIRILTNNSFEDTSAYYIIECKRLNATNPIGTSGLNAMYVKEGICRFTSKTYSTYYKTSGMIGFLVQKMDIDENVKAINSLLNNTYKEAKTKAFINKADFISEFEYVYSSIHGLGDYDLKIYHLMFDVSSNISSSRV